MKITVSGDFSKDLKIKFSQGTWKNSFYTLFEGLKAIDVELPKEPTLFRLSINYDSENFYFENVLYISNPNHDILAFHFYKENKRIYCKIKSEIVIELNKEILLNPLSESLKEMKSIMENFDNENSASH